MSRQENPKVDVVLTTSSEEIIPEIERKVGEQLPASFQSLPEQVRRETLSVVSHAAINISQVTWDGNFPPPQMLEEFNRVNLNYGDRIFAMAEINLTHAQDMDRRSSNYLFRGQLFGFILALTAMTGSIALIWHGEQVAGGLIGATILLPLVTLFVRGQIKIANATSSNAGANLANTSNGKRNNKPQGRQNRKR